MVRIGSTKAAVFPEPVGAATKASRPAIKMGRLCICTGVGSLYLRLSIFLSSTPRMWEWLPGLKQRIVHKNNVKKINKQKNSRTKTYGTDNYMVSGCTWARVDSGESWVWLPDCAACRRCWDLIKAFDWMGYVVAFHGYSHFFPKGFDLGHTILGHLLLIMRVIRDVGLGSHTASTLTKYWHHGIGLWMFTLFARFNSLFLLFCFGSSRCFRRPNWRGSFGWSDFWSGCFSFRVTTKKVQGTNGSTDSCI